MLKGIGLGKSRLINYDMLLCDRSIFLNNVHVMFECRYKLVVVGGGSGGCSVAAKFARKLRPKEIAIIEPADVRNEL